MTGDESIERLLRWRLARAEADAPPAPRASRLLELARPAWERWPERFEGFIQRLCAMQLSYGYALAGPLQGRPGHPVPTLIAHEDGTETFSRVLYLTVADSALRLRLQLDALVNDGAKAYDVTFVANPAGTPVASATARRSVDGEYRLDVELSDELARSWAQLKATDLMPFRLILHPAADDA